MFGDQTLVLPGYAKKYNLYMSQPAKTSEITFVFCFFFLGL